MTAFTSSFVLLVFLLGATCGAIVVAIERHARMERLQLAFQSSLESICERFRPDFDLSESPIRITEARPDVASASHSESPLEPTLNPVTEPGSITSAPAALVAAQTPVSVSGSHVSH